MARLFWNRASLAVPKVAGSGLHIRPACNGHYAPQPVHAILCAMIHHNSQPDHRHPGDSDQLDRFLALCLQVYQRMEREGTWPWADSPDSDNVVESKSNQKDI